MRDSFVLTWRALVRGHVLSLLLAATALAHAFLPAIVRGDGTEAGWREMFVRAVPGAAYAFIAVAVLSCACGLFAQERERFRLSLTVVRPASAFGVACGKWLALCAASAAALALSAEIEHSIDIDEGELPEDFVAGVRSRADGILEKARAAARRLREKRMLLGGALVVLAGPVNAGKSSLFNALAGSERAIVSAIPGTTRDSVETWLDIEGWPVRLVDTAGIRGRGADEVEDEGIRRAKALAEEADVVVSLGGDVPPGKPTIKTWPKCDLSRGEGLCVSAATGEGIEELKKAIAARLEALADGAGPADGERSDGRIAALLNAAAILGGTVEILDGGGEDSLVLAGNDLRRVCDTLAPFTGGDWTGDMIAALFSRFCVGK